jgi:hypothetical protein
MHLPEWGPSLAALAGFGFNDVETAYDPDICIPDNESALLVPSLERHVLLQPS